ncbi:MAG: hypothetical protein ACD_29C00097G0006 [uncultured bacterium]|nr:MAG: hypothetical protein ACD_29C00097G0006 [uncultured bacterium]
MLNLIKFNSKSYQEICWKNIFNSAGSAVFQDYQAFGLANSSGLVMMTDNAFSTDCIELCFENKIGRVVSNHLKPIPIKLFNDSGVLFYQLINKTFSTSQSHSYILFLNKIITSVYDACQIIFTYTYEHLAQRLYNDLSITQIESVQLQFVDTHILFERIHCLLSAELSIEQSIFVISLLIQALNYLAKLAGARAILKNNAVELIFYLKIFQKFINKNEI